MAFPVKPTTQPQWADGATPGVDIIEPGGAKKTQGWFSPLANPEKPPYQTFNWIHNTTFLWTTFLEDFFDELTNNIEIDSGSDFVRLFTAGAVLLLDAAGELTFTGGQAFFGDPSVENPLGVSRDDEAGDSTNRVIFDVGNKTILHGKMFIEYTNDAIAGSPSGGIRFTPRNNAGTNAIDLGSLIWTKTAGSDLSTLKLTNTVVDLFLNDDGTIRMNGNVGINADALTSLHIDQVNAQANGLTQNNLDNIFITRTTVDSDNKGPSICFGSPNDDNRSACIQAVQTGGTNEIGLQFVTRNAVGFSPNVGIPGINGGVYIDHEGNLRIEASGIFFDEDDRPNWQIEVIGGTQFKTVAIFRNTGFNGFKGLSLQGFSGTSTINPTSVDSSYSHLSILDGGLIVDEIVAFNTTAVVPPTISSFVQMFADSGNLLKLKLPDGSIRTLITSLDPSNAVTLIGPLTVPDVTINSGNLTIIDANLDRVASTPNNYLGLTNADFFIDAGFNLRLFDTFITRSSSSLITVTPTNVVLEVEGGFLNLNSGIAWKIIVLSIGVWNMDGDASVSIAHGQTLTDIIDVSAIIYNDALNSALEIKWSGDFDQLSGNIVTDGTNVVLNRRGAPSTFDNSNYNDSVINRGYIVLRVRI